MLSNKLEMKIGDFSKKDTDDTSDTDDNTFFKGKHLEPVALYMKHKLTYQIYLEADKLQ